MDTCSERQSREGYAWLHCWKGAASCKELQGSWGGVVVVGGGVREERGGELGSV